jgi:hypothetical protein
VQTPPRRDDRGEGGNAVVVLARKSRPLNRKSASVAPGILNLKFVEENGSSDFRVGRFIR